MDRFLHERRKAPRFPGELDLELENGRGVSRDFSVSGLYFEADRSFSLHETINLRMNLRYSDLGPRTGLSCRGEVVRIEPRGEKTGVAVAIKSFGIKGL